MDTNTRRIMLTHALFMQLFKHIVLNGESSYALDGDLIIEFADMPVMIKPDCIWFADIDTAFICTGGL